MRFFLYSLSGVVSALIGWSLSQIFLVDIKGLLIENPLIEEWLGGWHPDWFLLPIVAACLAIAMVTTEIFLSNPTRIKANSRVLPPYVWGAFGSGLVAGLLAATCTWLLHISNFEPGLVRVVAWSLVGFFTGLGESVSWRFRSIEGNTRKATLRLWRTAALGLVAGLVAAILIEVLRQIIDLGGFADPIGFLFLGLSLGLFLSFGTTSAYQMALRAGRGFELYDRQSQDPPRLKNPILRFVTEDSDEDENMIEEGLSIQLPDRLKHPLLIGSAENADIYLPNIPEKAASLSRKGQDFILQCLVDGTVRVNQDEKLRQEQVTLRHNQILVFYCNEQKDKFYRFAFYDRFLDPNA